MVLYEEYEHNWFRRIGSMDDYLKEKELRDRHGYGFFRLVNCKRDHGDICHVSDLDDQIRDAHPW